jgi:hypothetical protein
MPNPLKIRVLLKRLKDYGVILHPNPARGKGSEVVILKPNSHGSTKGPIFTLKNHGNKTEITTAVVLACLRRFGIDPEEFYKGV